MSRIRYDPAALRAAWWAWWSARRVQRSLQRSGLDGTHLPSAPRSVPSGDRRGVSAALARRGSSCLVSAIVLQRWDAAHGLRREIVIGVTGVDDFEAHAWLDGEPDDRHAGFVEIRRLRVSA